MAHRNFLHVLLASMPIYRLASMAKPQAQHKIVEILYGI